MIRVGVGSIAAGLAAFATGFISYMWLTSDSGQADGGSRAGTSDLFVSGSIHPKPGNLATATVDADMQGNSRLQFEKLETGDDSATAFREPEHRSKPSTRIKSVAALRGFDAAFDRFGHDLKLPFSNYVSSDQLRTFAAPPRHLTEHFAQMQMLSEFTVAKEASAR